MEIEQMKTSKGSGVYAFITSPSKLVSSKA